MARVNPWQPPLTETWPTSPVYPTYGSGYTFIPYEEPDTKEESMSTREQKIRSMREGIQVYAEEIAKLEALPAEPEVEGNAPIVITFTKQFQPHGTFYEYAAVGILRPGVNATNRGRVWYTTGPVESNNNPYGRSWDSLVDWIGPDTPIWMATTFEAI